MWNLLDRLIYIVSHGIVTGAIVLMLLLVTECVAKGDTNYGLGLTRLDLEYQKLNPENRDAYAPQYTGHWREQAAVLLDLRLLRWGYWANRIHMETTDPTGRATGTGWQWEAGLRMGPVDVFQFHHSRHLLDEPGVGEPHMFPVENAIGMRIRLLGDK